MRLAYTLTRNADGAHVTVLKSGSFAQLAVKLAEEEARWRVLCREPHRGAYTINVEPSAGPCADSKCIGVQHAWTRECSQCGLDHNGVCEVCNQHGLHLEGCAAIGTEKE